MASKSGFQRRSAHSSHNGRRRLVLLVELDGEHAQRQVGGSSVDLPPRMCTGREPPVRPVAARGRLVSSGLCRVQRWSAGGWGGLQEEAARRALDGGGVAQREGVYVLVDADAPTRHGTLEVLAPRLRPAVDAVRVPEAAAATEGQCVRIRLRAVPSLVSGWKITSQVVRRCRS